MKKIVIKLFQIVATLFLSSILVFLMIQAAPADPVTLMIAKPADGTAVEKEMMQQKIEDLKRAHGLNESLPNQYLYWLKNVLQGNLGKSIVTGSEIGGSLGRFLPNSILLAFFGMILEFLLALLVGVISATYVSKWQDHCMRFIGITFRSVPSFLVCVFLLSLFATKFRLYEVSNSANLSRLWLPVLAVGITSFPKLSRIIRNALLDEMGKQYVVSYLSKGFPRRKILKEALRNAVIPVFTTLSMNFATSIGGMAITESVFTWPGVGNYGMSSVLSQDYPAIQGYILVVTFFVIVINFLTDLLYPLVNPLLKRGRFL